MLALKLPDRRSIYWKSIFEIVLVILALSLQSCEAHQKHGAPTPDRVVEQYFTALEARNETAIRQLMPENSLATDLVKIKIDRLGGYKITDRHINYTKPKPSRWNAKLHGMYIDRFGVKRKFEDSIVLAYQSKGELKLYAGHWYLLLEVNSK